MSMYNQILVALSVIIVIVPFLFYSPYLTITFLVFSLLVYLYIDYENSQSRGGPANTTSQLISNCFQNFNFSWTWTIPNALREYRLSNPFTKAYYQSLNMPSIGSQENIRRPVRGNLGYVVSPNLNLSDQRKVGSSSSSSVSRPVFAIPNGDSFNALSPIKSDLFWKNNTSLTTYDRLRNISIGEECSAKPYQRTPTQLERASPSYTLNSTKNSSSSMNHSTPGSTSRNVHSFTGLLPTSTRYNLSSDSVTFADVNSPGLSTRVAQYGNSSPNTSSGATRQATHQTQYSSPGQFPVVYLGKTTKLPVLTSRNTTKVAHGPVRIRMAPLESQERRSYVLSDRSRALGDYSETPPKSVLDTLHEISRKRLHAQLGDQEAESVKKQRINASEKRERENTPLEEETSLKKRTRSNEITSSLSSSQRLLDRPSKRKTTVETDGHEINATVPAGKVAKTSVPSPEVIVPPITVNFEPPCEDELMPEAVTPTPQSKPPPFVEVQVPSPLNVKIQRTPQSEFLHKEFSSVSDSLDLDQLRRHRLMSTKNRLLDMLSSIGAEDKDVDLTPPAPAQTAFSTPSSAPSLPSFLSSTPQTTSALSTMFQTSESKTEKKHVHFDDTLQIKTFDVTSSTDTSTSQYTVTNFAASPAKPALGFFSPLNGNTIAHSTTTTINTAPISSAAVQEQKSPMSSATFGQNTTTTSLLTTFSSAVPELATSTSAAPAVTFGSPAISLPSFGSAVTSAASFGSPSPSVMSFGTPSTSVVSFGSSATARTTTTAAPVTSAQTFALPVSTTPPFGPTTASANTFGSPATTVPSFGTATTPAMTFGTPAPSLPSFGSTTTPAMTFGSPATLSSSGFATSSTTAPALSSTTTPAATTAVPIFGATTAGLSFGSNSNATFGLTSSSFASPTVSAPIFGTVTTSASVFGGSTFGASVTSSPGFGAAQTTFGNSAPPPYPGSGKANDVMASSTAASKTDKLFALSSGTQSAGFGGATNSTFGGFSAQQESTFGAKPFAFSNTNATSAEASSVFGGKPAGTTSSHFQFNAGGSSSVTGQAKVGGFKFEVPQAKPAVTQSFGMFSPTNQATGASSVATTQAQSAFSFNSAASKPFGSTFGNADLTTNQTAPSSFDTNTFGSAVTAQKPAVFGFGGTTPAASSFSFNAAPKAPSSFGFPQASPVFGQQQSATPAFGQSQTATPAFGQSQPATPAFGQSQPATPAFGQSQLPANTFQFGAPAATNSGGGFNFGSAAAAPTPTFGGAAPNNAFQMGAAAQFGGQQAPAGAGMFSIGTGTSGTRGRSGMRSRIRR